MFEFITLFTFDKENYIAQKINDGIFGLYMPH